MNIPHQPDTEAAVIGCCLTDPVNCIPQCQSIITSEDWFHIHLNKLLWNAIKESPENSDFVTISQKLKGHSEHINRCMDIVHSTAHLPVWLAELEKCHIQRKLIAACLDIASRCREDEKDILDSAEREILAIRPARGQSEPIKELVRRAINRIETMATAGGITGLSTGLKDLDQKTDGLHPGESIIIAAQTSVGKTALAINIAVHNALKGIPVAIFSAEMSSVQLVIRALCAEARVNHRRIMEQDARKLTLVVPRISKAPIFIENASGLTMGQVCAISRRLHSQEGIKLFVIDYLQLITGSGDNREQEVSNVSKGVKSIAMELDCSVIALSQLTDEGRLRESRAIGHDADSVWKLDNDGEKTNDVQPVNLHIDKSRDGETGTVKLVFFKTFTRFESETKIFPDA